jgi:hypothetical protein
MAVKTARGRPKQAAPSWWSRFTVTGKIVGGVLAAAVAAITIYEAARKYNWVGFGAHATIWSPERDSTIGASVHLRGEVQNVEGRHVWVVTGREPGGEIYPKGELNPERSGAFEQIVPTSTTDGPLDICIVTVDESTSRLFKEFRAKATKTGDWSGAPMPQGGILTCASYKLRASAGL